MVTQEEALKAWLEALRGKQYTQSTGMLRSTEGYCCLGVGCDVLMKHVGGSWEEEFGGMYRVRGIDEFVYGSALPDPIKDLLGFTHDIGTFQFTDELVTKFPKLQEARESYLDGGCSLTALNDRYHWTFEEIADLIEAKPPSLFKETVNAGQ